MHYLNFNFSLKKRLQVLPDAFYNDVTLSEFKCLWGEKQIADYPLLMHLLTSLKGVSYYFSPENSPETLTLCCQIVEKSSFSLRERTFIMNAAYINNITGRLSILTGCQESNDSCKKFKLRKGSVYNSAQESIEV